jgi:hypothetical protein
MPVGAIWPETLASLRLEMVDGWGAWTYSDQSPVVGAYFVVPIPSLVGDWVVELYLTLRTENDAGWFTRYRLLRDGVLANNASAVIGSWTSQIYQQANYSVVLVNGAPFLRVDLAGGSATLTTKNVSYRWRELL